MEQNGILRLNNAFEKTDLDDSEWTLSISIAIKFISNDGILF